MFGHSGSADRAGGSEFEAIGMDMSEDEGLSGDSTATRESEAAERSLATTDGLISIINKQVEDALKPLLSVLRGVEEDEHKHQEKLLAIEKRKLALKNEKVLLFTRHGAPSWNSPISQPQVGPINVMGNAGSSPEPVKGTNDLFGQDGTEEKGAVSARPSSGSDGILQPSKLSKTDVTKHKTLDDENLPIANKLVAFPAVRFCLSDDSNEGDHSVERLDRSSEGDHSHSDKNLPKVVACSNGRSCLSDESNEGVQSDVFKDRLSEGDHTLPVDLPKLDKVERRVYREHFRPEDWVEKTDKLVSGHPNGPPKIVTEDETSDDTKRVRLFGQILTPPGMRPCSPGRTPEADSFLPGIGAKLVLYGALDAKSPASSEEGEVQSTGSCVSSVGQQHQPVSALGKRGAADGGGQEDAQLPAKALKQDSVICKSVIVNPTLKSKLELAGACEQENSSVVSAFNLKNEKILLFTRHGAPSWNSPISQPQVGPINVMGNAGSSPEPVKDTNDIFGGGGEREAGAAVKSEPDEQTVMGTPATLSSAKDRLFFNLGGGQSRGTEEKSLERDAGGRQGNGSSVVSGGGDSLKIGLKLGQRTYFKDFGGGGQAEPGQAKEASSAEVARCQVDGCKADLSGCKDYYKRYKVCEMHSKAPKVIAGGIEQRFCQQCSRFHLPSEFDEGKRSCRRRLGGHSERRRKPHPETHSVFGLRNVLYGDTSRLGFDSSPYYFLEETMRAKQMLATMSHEIRSPLSGVISMASILARTPLNEDQKLQVDFMIKSGNDVLDLINDILDLSKVEAGAMTFEAKKFRPREVVKHVVQMASTSVAADNKTIQVESDVSEDVPLEVVGDELRIRQVLTNLVSNSVKFTHKGKVSIIVRGVEPSSFKNQDHMKPKQLSACEFDDSSQRQSMECSYLPVPMTVSSPLESPHIFHKNGLADPLSTPVSNIGAMFSESNLRTVPRDERLLSSVKPSNTCQRSDISGDVATALDKQRTEEQISASSLLSRNAAERVALANTGELVKDLLWVEFQVVDTGIGIPESAIPTLFKRSSLASSTHARKYGGTGLGLHICKQLVELMGGSIRVLNKEGDGSLFSFKLPLRPVQQDSSNPISNDEIECVRDQEDVACTDAPGSLPNMTSPKTPWHPNLKIVVVK